MTISEINTSLPPWLLLTFCLPRRGASLRVSVWRKLQRYGSLPLGNSRYPLASSPSNREKFEWLATTIRGSRGEASVLEVQSIDNYSVPQLAKRFSEARTQDYRELLQTLRQVSPGRHSSQIARLRQRFQEIVSIDFFGSPLRAQVEKRLSMRQEPKPKEPAPELSKPSRSAFRGRTWVTRPCPGVDRVMSAWLIRKFIDPKARFLFASEDQRRKEGVSFDMHEGGFGHRGEDWTFETLTKAFRISDKRDCRGGGNRP